jgi:hypothetical protein
MPKTQRRDDFAKGGSHQEKPKLRRKSLAAVVTGLPLLAGCRAIPTNENSTQRSNRRCRCVMPGFPQIMDLLQRVTASLARYPVMGLL